MSIFRIAVCAIKIAMAGESTLIYLLRRILLTGGVNTLCLRDAATAKQGRIGGQFDPIIQNGTV